MAIIPQLWDRLNVLVPEPDCYTQGNEYTTIIWRDVRTQPTEAALLAVTQAQIDTTLFDQEADRETDPSARWRRFFFEIFFDLENRMRVQEALGSVTKAQYKAALKTLYLSLP